MPRFRNNLSAVATQGFTLAEMILVVAVMAILVTVTAGPLYLFLQQRDLREEQTTELELQKAVKAYLKANRTLPTAANWYTELSRYTNLSPNQILTDVWGQNRVFTPYTDTETFLGNDIKIFYATVLSKGPDLKATAATGIPVTGTGYAAASSTAWWNMGAVANRITVYNNLTPGGDDQLMRVTDYADKIDAYQKTLGRLTAVAGALETYAKNKYAEVALAYREDDPATPANEAVAVYNAGGTATIPEKMIYYPPSYSQQVNVGAMPNSWNSAAPTRDSFAAYSRDVVNEFITVAGSGNGTVFNGYNTAANDTARYTAMVNLMRLLGLPDEDCCSALDSFTDSNGVIRELPFYYASNPRPRNNGTCGTHTNPAVSVPLPARVGVKPPSDTDSCY